MNATRCAIPEVMLLEPQAHVDERGFVFESFSQRVFNRATGLDAVFVQDNHSRSGQRVLRGLHYQVKQPQGKLVRVAAGEAFAVAVDIRRSSATFGKWVGESLSAGNRRQLWLPAGFAHGFLVMSESADVLYKITDYYAPEHERCIAWNDPTLAIDWPLHGAAPQLSGKDSMGTAFLKAELLG